MMEQTSSQTNTKHFWNRTRIIALVVVLGFLLRLWAAWQLPQDFDEPVYIDAGYKYAQLIQDGDLNGIIDYTGNSDHPPLVKLVYGLTFLAFGRGSDWSSSLFIARMVSVIFGSLATLVLALFNPLAGGLMAVQTLLVKYTSQAYLEAVPLFFSLLAITLLLRAEPGRNKWFFLSALGLGIAGAAKYSYFPILFVILFILIWEKAERPFDIILYFLMAGTTFLVFNPMLWHSPIQRLIESINFHASYSQGSHVQQVNYPWYQPILWVSRSHGFQWHPDVFFYLGIDGLIFLLALPGLWWLRKSQRWILVWVVTSMLALLLYPTKWPQYTLVVLPAFCLAASAAITKLYGMIREQELYWEWLHNMFPRPARRYLVIGSVLLGLLFVGALASQVIIAINRIGWSTMTTKTSGLPNDAINDMLAIPDGRILLGTDGGAAFWKPASSEKLLDEWVVFTPQNSPLPGQKVLSVALDLDGEFWFGTDAGLASYDGNTWSVYNQSNIGFESMQVNSIVVDDQNRVWIGTMGGAAVLENGAWRSYTLENSGLVDNAVFSITVEPHTPADLIWFGTLSGVARLDPTTGEWLSFNRDVVDLGWGGVSDLVIDSSGKLWVCTEGGGISLWDGSDWTHIRVSNSKLPYSTIETVAELEPGVYWLAASIPNTAGGVLVKYDGTNWHIFREGFSGYSGAETVSIVKDNHQRYWFGTRTDGIDIYEPNQ